MFFFLIANTKHRSYPLPLSHSLYMRGYMYIYSTTYEVLSIGFPVENIMEAL